MANSRDIRRRIKSVKSTSQITKAMQLVAASKMKKAQDQALNGRPFADTLNRTINRMKDKLDLDDVHHPLLEEREVKKRLLVVVNTDKGLCGGLNANLLKVVLAQLGEDVETDVITVGKKLRGTLARSGANLVADFPCSDPVTFDDTKTVSRYVIEKFSEGEYDEVKLAFTNFVNTLSQVPKAETMLPVNVIDLGTSKGSKGDADADTAAPDLTSGYLIEPGPAEVFSTALPMYVHYQLYQSVLEARASEHSARMVAMKSATDNAKQLGDDLTLEYNKVRQAAITNELLEITTAMKALE